MNQLRNKVQLIGHLGADPEVKALDGGKMVAKMTLATNDYYKNQKGEKIEETQWHQLVAWNKSAEFAEKYLKKGKEVAIEGKLSNRSYEDKDGNKRYVSEVVVNDFLLLGGKN